MQDIDKVFPRENTFKNTLGKKSQNNRQKKTT